LTDKPLQLAWLPEHLNWNAQLDRARQMEPARAIKELVVLANHRVDFIQTARLDRALLRIPSAERVSASSATPIRLAVLGSSTLSHLIPAVRIGALRRGIHVDIYEAPYGMYRQELADRTSGLHDFKPDVVLLALDAYHLNGREGATWEEGLRAMEDCWSMTKRSLGAVVVQQTVLPVFHTLLGNNEHRHARSAQSSVWRLNHQLRDLADAQGVHLLAVDTLAAADGVNAWHDEALWHRSKQEIHPRVSHIYGDHVGRLLAAIRGRSRKCLVLDLDNTLWGGVIGDDGLAGIAIGQGSAVGEAHLSFQRYVRALAGRGVVLAVCSKNDEATALEAFDKHPEMLLGLQDIACFVANWDDKASNLRRIAQRLNIGVDSLVFADDNPFERNLVRQELPEVAVPELPEDPAGFAACIAAAGYFESLSVTTEDEARTAQYKANAEREQLRESVTDMGAYLASLKMELQYKRFDRIGLPRIVQLINKTNQFNLTTRRYTEPEVESLLIDASVLHLQFRLLDRFGDNGIIAVVIGRLNEGREMLLDTWLMSCRVLGRHVEAATLNVLAARARQMGASALVGVFRPSAKNGMVKDHYLKLGFEPADAVDGETTWRLSLTTYDFIETPITLVEGAE
jgi:FkbH-like protein